MPEVPEFIRLRYAHHAPKTEERVHAHEALREEFALLAAVLESTLPAGREKSIAHTLLQEASWAAHAALAIGEAEAASV